MSSICQVCTATFPTITDKAVHVSTEHNIRRTGATEHTLPLWACQHCTPGTHIGDGPCDTCGAPGTSRTRPGTKTTSHQPN